MHSDEPVIGFRPLFALWARHLESRWVSHKTDVFLRGKRDLRNELQGLQG